MAKGYVSSVSEAFDKLLKEGLGYYFPAKRITPMAAIRFIKVYGATAIMAHPLLNLNEEQLQVFLPEAKEAGLDAIETHYSKFDDSMTAVLVSLAERFGLKQSGGSDFHGTTKPDIELGTGRGNLFVPHSFYEDLLACANQNK